MATATEQDQDVQANGEATQADEPPISHDAETLARIVELNQHVSKARVKYDHADRQRKMAKEDLEIHQAALNEFIAGLSEEYPLFDREAEKGEADDWRGIHVEKLTQFGLPGPIVGLLVEAGLTTIGGVADWTAGKPLTDIPGVGPTKAEKIADALEGFWREQGNAAIQAAVQETEAEAAPDAWRLATIDTLGLAEETVDLLDRHVIATAGELVALVQLGAAWMGPEAQADVEAALTRFRHRRSNAEIEDFDLARGGEPWPEEGKGKRTRKAKAS